MTTYQVKVIVKRQLRRPIGIEELYKIAQEMGKVKPVQTHDSGGVTYKWTESEIPFVLQKLKEN